MLGCLRAVGFSLEMTVHADSVQDAYIYGFALQERDMSSASADDFAAEAQRQLHAYQAVLADYPHLVEVVGGYVAKAGCGYDTDFLCGARPHPRRPREAPLRLSPLGISCVSRRRA